MSMAQNDRLRGLWRDVEGGVYDIESAERLARMFTAGEDVSETALQKANVDAKNLALGGQARNGAWLGRLALAASKAPALATSARIRSYMAAEFLETAQLSLIKVADPSLLSMAERYGEEALAWARQVEDGLCIEVCTFRLGTLYLDPYTAKRDLRTYWLQHASWLRHGIIELRETIREPLTDDLMQTFMPSPLEALRRADCYLEQAVQVRTGRYRGLALKARAQTMLFLRGVGAAVESSQIDALALEALSLLSEADVEARQYVFQLLSGPARASAFPNKPSEEPSGQYDKSEAHLIAAHAEVDHDPDSAIAHLSERRKILTSQEDPDWVQQLTSEICIRVEAERSHGGLSVLTWPVDDDSQRELIECTAASPHSARARAASLLGLAEQAASSGVGSKRGIDCMESARNIDRTIVDELGTAATFLQARLEFDMAGHYQRASEIQEQPRANNLVRAYLRAADLFLQSGTVDLAVMAVEYLTPFVKQLHPNDATELVPDIASVNMRLDGRADTETDRVVQELYARLLGTLFAAGTPNGIIVLLSELAKGSRLRAALESKQPVGSQLPTDLRRDLSDVDALETDMLNRGLVDDYDYADDGNLLVSFADTRESFATDTALQRLRNRQQYLDRAWSRSLPRPQNRVLYGLDGIARQLDRRTALLMMVPAAWRGETWGSLWTLITNDDFFKQFVDSELPYQEVDIKVAGRSSRTPPDGMMWRELLRSLQNDDSGSAPATEDALKILDGPRRFGDLWTRIGKVIASGRDRLLIAPHGPGHFVPWHLFGPPGSPIGTRATVSVLPNLALLSPGSFTELALSRLRSRPVASFGLTYQTVPSYGQGELEKTDDEAAEIAAAFGEKAIIEECATTDKFLEGLQTARHVHIAAHGRHNAYGPAFQSIYLAGNRGILRAHQIASCDLRGLRLVTLGACETALGRFDRGDNVKGIPAALLLAGAQSVVGTLWNVTNNTARLFFPEMYRCLAAGRSVEVAFRTAQHATRQAFPTYGDWGAFQLFGRLDGRYAAAKFE
jgi:hypothetical protein